MEGFVHGQLADCGKSLPEQDARNADRGNPRRFHRSAKWTKAMEGFVHGQLGGGDLGGAEFCRAAPRVSLDLFVRGLDWRSREVLPYLAVAKRLFHQPVLE